MADQTDNPTIVMDPVRDREADEPPPPPQHGTGLALAAGGLAFLVVLVAFLAFFAGGDGGESGTESSEPAARRIAGEDRYETAAAISARAFPDSASVVYLVPTDVSPAVAASTLGDGPVLVVPPCGVLPEVIAAEIRRLDPAEVIALGDEEAVCDDIVRQAVQR
jgi:hypothetical protein